MYEHPKVIHGAPEDNPNGPKETFIRADVAAQRGIPITPETTVRVLIIGDPSGRRVEYVRARGET